MLQDAQSQAVMREQHERYRLLRWSLLSAEHQQYVVESGWKEKFDKTGIAGLENWVSVKCLHAHFAHFCYHGDNLIGTWLRADFNL